MLRLITVFTVLFLVTGCAGRLYSPPSGDNVAVLSVDNQLVNETAASDGGWQMPMVGMGAEAQTKVEVFEVDGRRVAEQGGAEVIRLSPGMRAVQIFADRQGVLRFADFEHDFERAGRYQVRVTNSERLDYRLELINERAPGRVLVEHDF